MTVYPDTSFFVSLYLSDKHSDEADALMAQSAVVFLTSFHRAEWAHAISYHVFQRKMSAEEAGNLHRKFQRDRMSGLWREASVPETAYEKCIAIALQHAPRLGVRTLDTLHIATAIELRAEAFWTFDKRQTKLAEAEGLKLS